MRHRDKQVMDLAELGEQTGLSRDQLLAMIRRGRLTAIQPGGEQNSKYFVPIAEAERLLQPVGAEK